MPTPVKPQLIPSWHNNYARNATQSRFPDLWDELKGLWVPALGPTGTVLRDMSHGGNHGALIAMDAATDWTVTPMGYSLDFVAGSSQYVNVGRPHIPVDSLVSIVAWVNTTDLTISEAVFGWRFSFKFGIEGNVAGDPLRFTNFGVIDVDSASSGISANTLIHIAFTYDKKNVVFYLNGKHLSTSAQTGTIGTSDGDYFIGAYNDEGVPGDSWSGKVLSLGYYARALNPDQVFTLYRNPYAPLLLRSQAVGKAAAVADDMSHYQSEPPLNRTTYRGIGLRLIK